MEFVAVLRQMTHLALQGVVWAVILAALGVVLWATWVARRR